MRFYLVPLLLVSTAHGFVVVSTTRAPRPSQPTRLSMTDESGDAQFDLEAVRQRLESLVDSSAGLSATNSPSVLDKKRPTTPAVSLPVLDVTLPPPPPLTSLDRERRQAELELLKQLQSDDEALSDLWTLWFQERGAKAAAKLVQAEEWTGQGPSSWPEAEAILRDLIAEYGVYWAEPVNRLSTLYYMQGRLEEAETLCKMVLAVKPWHFGALSGIVMIYAGLQEASMARQWAARRLPTLAPSGPNRRRQAWVEQAIGDATTMLEQAEERLRLAFGEPDAHVTGEINEETAWQ